MSVPTMTLDAPVWVSTARSGISFHHLEDDFRHTLCGRYVGRGEGLVDRGHVLPLAEAEKFATKACRTCVDGSGVAPRCVPSKDRRG